MAHIFSPIGLCLLSDKKKQTQNVNKTLQKIILLMNTKININIVGPT